MFSSQIAGLLYICVVAAGGSVHIIFSVLRPLPTARPPLHEMTKFAFDSTFFLNLFFGAVASGLVYLPLSRQRAKGGAKSKGTKGAKSAH